MASSGPFIQCQPASDGVVMGFAVIKSASLEILPAPHAPAGGAWTLDDFLRTLKRTREQLVVFQKTIQERIPEQVSQIFSAHLAILDDEEFSGRIRGKIESGAPVGEAITGVWKEYDGALSTSANPRLREKIQDLADIVNRLMSNLAESGNQGAVADYRGKILITPSLFPSDILRLIAQKIEGVILTSGGVTAHISVIARSLELPMVLADAALLGEIGEGTPLLLDAHLGVVYINPPHIVQEGYKSLLETNGKALPGERDVLPQTHTRDGCRIRLLSAIGLVSEAKLGAELMAEGIGLYRSEMPFLIRNGFPSEDEQCMVYRKIAEENGKREIVFRTLDIGGDKILRYFPTPEEPNPFLGLRGIRFSLRHLEIFETQVRAILRAGFDRPIKIMFPLVPSVDSFLFAKGIVKRLASDLEASKIHHQDIPEIGAMIELPCAVGVADELAAEADFLSIGTNDLVQYMLAIDRTNGQMSDWYVPWHPAVLKAIKAVANAAHNQGKPLSVCGDMASAAKLVPVLVGLGITNLTVPPRSIPHVQKIVQAIDAGAAKDLAERAMGSRTVAEAARLIGVEWKPAWIERRGS
jgi:phosphotransferase system, enzyme I, PtsP